MIVFFKSKKMDAFGTIIGGLGILFMGMEMMSNAMVPLRSSPDFIRIVSTFENPFIGILDVYKRQEVNNEYFKC